jgi:hypothetical protein
MPAGANQRSAKSWQTSRDLPLYALDKVQYQPGGAEVSDADDQQAHAQILATEQWILDEFGSLDIVWLRLEAADTSIYVDLPLPLHIWWVTQRCSRVD